MPLCSREAPQFCLGTQKAKQKATYGGVVHGSHLATDQCSESLPVPSRVLTRVSVSCLTEYSNSHSWGFLQKATYIFSYQRQGDVNVSASPGILEKGHILTDSKSEEEKPECTFLRRNLHHQDVCIP